MSSMVDKLIAVATAEVGYLEKKSNSQLNSKTANAGSANYTKYGAWYQGGWANGLAWCNIFVVWCARQAGILKTIIPDESACRNTVSWFSKQKRWHLANSGKFKPKKGDLIIFTNTPSNPIGNHIGIVYAADSNYVYTIEGNTSGGSTLIANGGGVAKKKYKLSYNKIYGYCRPAYVEEEEYMPEKVNMSVNGVIRPMNSIEYNGENYVRLRDMEAAGLEIGYDTAKRLPSIDIAPIEKLKMTVDGKPMSIPNFQLNGTNYGGVRAIMESLGYNVNWDSTTYTVVCTTKK